jgi:hypothetical protein
MGLMVLGHLFMNLEGISYSMQQWPLYCMMLICLKRADICDNVHLVHMYNDKYSMYLYRFSIDFFLDLISLSGVCIY